MPRILKFKYGSGDLSLDLPDSALGLIHKEPVERVDPESLAHDLQTWLHSLKRRVGSVGIAISDKTRLCEYRRYLPLLTRTLMDAGIRKESICFFISYGTHAPQTEEECLASYGESYRKFRFVHHDSRDKAAMKNLGTTTRGTVVRINTEILEKDLLISFGALSHHYFAGFGGGRKLLFPGLAAYDSILQNHRLFLDFKKQRLEPGCQSGKLKGNPLAEDLEEISSMLPERLEILGILNSQRRVCELHFAFQHRQFTEACERYDEHFRIGDRKSYDLVVASAGGYPKDINYIQVHKSIHNAASFVKDGGQLLILAECRDGIGNKDFLELFSRKEDELYSALGKTYINNAGTALATREKTRRIHIHIMTSLPAADCTCMGLHPCSMEDAVGIITGEEGETAFIENASILYA